MLTAYPTSLNEVSFFGRNMTARNASLRAGTGAQWERDAAIMTELKLQCVAAFFSDMNSMRGNTANYHYRYNVLDTTPGGLADTGIFTPHTSELYAIWGTNNTDGNDPKCFKLATADGGCAEAISIVSSYWISFVRTLDPNTFRAAGAPHWQPWSIASPQRILFGNGEASMESMGAGIGEVIIAGLNQRDRCNTLTLPLAKAINIGLKAGESLPPFANGTAQDPTLGVVAVNVSATMGGVFIENDDGTNITTNGTTITINGTTILLLPPNTTVPINGSSVILPNGTEITLPDGISVLGSSPTAGSTVGSGANGTQTGGATLTISNSVPLVKATGGAASMGRSGPFVAVLAAHAAAVVMF